MKYIWNTMRQNIYPLLIIAIGVILCAVNYTPNTWLSGWDTLHPEFNFSLSFERMINGVWRSDQGLGAVAGHSHMADLPRVALLFIANIIVNPSLLRYGYFFLMLITGPLGIYFLTKTIMDSRLPFGTAQGKRGNDNVKPVAFIAGLTYLLNLGTLQQFLVPFEMFGAAYGILPWVFYTAIRFLNHTTKKNIFAFIISIILIMPMAYAATLWYATVGGFFIFIILYGGLKRWKQSTFLIAITVLFNLYWIAPNLYMTVNHGQEIREAKVNQLFSPEAFAKNQGFGTPENAMILRNFLFDWNMYNPNTGGFEDITAEWKLHLASPATKSIGYGVFAMAIIGIAGALWKKTRIATTLIPVWAIGFIMLLSGTWPIADLFSWLQTIFPVASEALRFPFTKFSILYMVPFSVFVGLGFQILLTLANSKTTVIIATVEVTLALIAYMLPAFTGHLVHPAMRIHIPTEYFQMFDWFSTQKKEERVAILPIHTFWNWTYNSWGYQGAGFLQFGIPQPILDRDYDRWSPYNEQYQREMAYAIYSQQPDVIQLVVKKYRIRWILVDTSVVAPGENKNVTFTWRIPKLLSDAGINVSKQFGTDLTVYDARSLIEKSADTVSYLSKRDGMTIPFDTTYATIGSYADTPINTELTQRDRIDRLRIPVEVTKNITVAYPIFDAKGSASIPLPELSHNNAYVVSIASKNYSGFPAQLCIANMLTYHCELFTRLHWGVRSDTELFLIPPFYDFGFGYTINLKNDTIGTIKPDNEITMIIIDEIAWPAAHHTVEGAIQPRVLWQGYETGWRAYEIDMCQASGVMCQVKNKIHELLPFVFGKELTDHVRINGWANGWTIKSDQSDQFTNQTNKNSMLIFIFLPQYLEYGGALVGLLTILVITLKKHYEA